MIIRVIADLVSCFSCLLHNFRMLRRIAFVRPPYGSITSVGASVIQRPIIEWSVDSEDWKTRNPDLILQKIQATVYDGAINHSMIGRWITLAPTLVIEP